MKARKIIFYLVLIFFFSGLAYFLWQVWQRRYDYFFQGKQLERTTENSLSPTVSPNSLTATSVSPEIILEDNQQQKDNVQDILENHCNQNCRRKVDIEEKKYCLEICGLNQSQEVSGESSCVSLSGQEADICWKNLAIKEKKGSFCDKIEDKGMKESCQNRLVEELLK